MVKRIHTQNWYNWITCLRLNSIQCSNILCVMNAFGYRITVEPPFFSSVTFFVGTLVLLRACVRVRIYRVFVLRSECLSSFDFVILLFKALTMCLMNSMIVHTASTKFVIIAGTAYWIKLTKQKGNKRQKRKKENYE